MNYEYVYILTNPAMPDWVKVGKAKDINNRIASLNEKTAVPLPFECFAALKVPAENVFNIEHGLHKFLGFSYQKEKEFFRTTKERVLEFFEVTHSMFPDSELLLEGDLNKETPAEKKKAAATTFALLNIPVGSKLVFIKNPSIVCEVAGYQYFTFEDELLSERRQRLHPNL